MRPPVFRTYRKNPPASLYEISLEEKASFSPFFQAEDRPLRVQKFEAAFSASTGERVARRSDRISSDLLARQPILLELSSPNEQGLLTDWARPAAPMEEWARTSRARPKTTSNGLVVPGRFGGSEEIVRRSARPASLPGTFITEPGLGDFASNYKYAYDSFHGALYLETSENEPVRAEAGLHLSFGRGQKMEAVSGQSRVVSVGGLPQGVLKLRREWNLEDRREAPTPLPEEEMDAPGYTLAGGAPIPGGLVFRVSASSESDLENARAAARETLPAGSVIIGEVNE